LPTDAAALVYTSAIEEINVLMKIGLYAGIFISTPVLLWQIWGFVSPGLFAAERKMAAPFVLAGTLCFVGGAAFAYFVVLPPAFEFLLKPEETRDQRVVLLRAKGRIDDAGRLLKAGDLPGAERLVALGEGDLGGLPAASETDAAALVARANALDPLLDAADRAVGKSGQGALALQQAIAARERARSSALAGATTDAGRARGAEGAAARRAGGRQQPAPTHCAIGNGDCAPPRASRGVEAAGRSRCLRGATWSCAAAGLRRDLRDPGGLRAARRARPHRRDGARAGAPLRDRRERDRRGDPHADGRSAEPGAHGRADDPLLRDRDHRREADLAPPPRPDRRRDRLIRPDVAHLAACRPVRSSG
jgi:hypothetical protein